MVGLFTTPLKTIRNGVPGVVDAVPPLTGKKIVEREVLTTPIVIFAEAVTEEPENENPEGKST